ncbi:MAG: hypothetical protein FJ265_22170, partial [Planctomycetes bacterium]|nr:hypothetical protein [Planctomycetota bacterium]
MAPWLLRRWIPLLLPATLPAQQPRWQVPQAGCVTFRAIEDFDPMPAGGKLPGCALPHAPVLLHSEFAADGTHLAIEPQDWRWIALHV